MVTVRRMTLRTKLFAGLGAVGLLIAVLLLFGNRILSESAQRMEVSLNAEVRPLVRMNRLQVRIQRVRALEIELPRLADYFAVTTQRELLRSEVTAFSDDLAMFVRDRPVENNYTALLDNWNRYKADLDLIVSQGTAMDMKRVEASSTYESVVHFKSVAGILQEFSENIERRARRTRDAALLRQKQQEQVFLLTSVAGLAVLAVGLFLFARSLAMRVDALRNAALRIADGESGIDIEPGEDELSDLGYAFDVMRKKVEDREHDLRVANAEQETRVAQRTSELNDSNRQLRLEIEERRRAEQQLHLLSKAVEQSPVSTLITGIDSRIEYVNEAFVQSTGWTQSDVLGRTLQEIEPDRYSLDQYHSAWETVRQGQMWIGEFSYVRADGVKVWELERISPVSAGAGDVSHYVVIRENVTLRKQQEEKILFQAHYDHLTKLPNRILAMDRLSQAIVGAARANDRVALMFIDLDDFKKVNDSLGHDAGDALLMQAAQRLRNAVRHSDTVARQGGDEFLVIMSELHDPTDAEVVATKILSAFADDFVLGENVAVVTPSIGLAIYPDDGANAGELLRNADLAMYDAKEAGCNTYRFFNKLIHEQSAQRLALEHDLRQALARDEFQLHYQPLIDARDRRLIGAEALLRWNSARHGRVEPSFFIGLAEHTGLIIDIGRWVLRTACRQAAQWRTAGHEDFHISVNVSPRQFRGSDFLEHVREALSSSGLPPTNLKIEVTEGLLIRNAPEVSDILNELALLGVGIAMDDFGTGYSSLSCLKRFPFNWIKIDREFIHRIEVDHDDRVLVAAIIGMGKALGMVVVAEGVESAAQLAFLADLDCDIVQGFYFSCPVSADEMLSEWLTKADEQIKTIVS
jgi:diguanylate cyclase (GGDEF)-like protein/PAS domain S-box-containing protein